MAAGGGRARGLNGTVPPRWRYRSDDGIHRLGDVMVALIGLVVLLPLAVGIAAAMLVFDRGPLFFAQPRIGRDGRPFLCLKFRTMRPGAHDALHDLLAGDPRAQRDWARHHKILDDPRVTPLGRLLRRLSLDEWPQFANVLWGSMGVVGPRPIVAGEVIRYGPHFPTYCSVRPGLTGLWRISGRADLSYDRRVALDVAYVRARSPWRDLRILAATPLCIVGLRGAY